MFVVIVGIHLVSYLAIFLSERKSSNIHTYTGTYHNIPNKGFFFGA